MANLGLPYAISFLGADEAPKAIRSLLEAEAPALFYLWYLLGAPLEYSEYYPSRTLEYPWITLEYR
jgi:hypothetical protein